MNIEPGPELDAQIAELLGCQPYFRDMGWDEDGGPRYAFCGCKDGSDHWDNEAHSLTLYRYSTDTRAALEAAEELGLFNNNSVIWRETWGDRLWCFGYLCWEQLEAEVKANTFSFLLCRAILYKNMLHAWE